METPAKIKAGDTVDILLFNNEHLAKNALILHYPRNGEPLQYAEDDAIVSVIGPCLLIRRDNEKIAKMIVAKHPDRETQRISALKELRAALQIPLAQAIAYYEKYHDPK